MDTQLIHPEAPESYAYLAVIDLECTCDDNEIFGPHEIIETGGVIGMLSQESFKVISELQIYVKPVINPTLTNFCTELTGITQSTVDSAIILNDALPALESWLQTNNIAAWASWGKFDANQFARECELKSVENPVARIQHLNVKQLFARKFGYHVGLERALDLLGLTFAGASTAALMTRKISLGWLALSRYYVKLYKRITTITPVTKSA